jgi:alkylhydroperoxidase family enzyme
MAFIPYLPYEEAEGLLAELFRRFGSPSGELDSIIRIHSLNPPSMDHHMRLYSHLMRGPSPLTWVQREMIALAVSSANQCFY